MTNSTVKNKSNRGNKIRKQLWVSMQMRVKGAVHWLQWIIFVSHDLHGALESTSESKTMHKYRLKQIKQQKQFTLLCGAAFSESYVSVRLPPCKSCLVRSLMLAACFLFCVTSSSLSSSTRVFSWEVSVCSIVFSACRVCTSSCLCCSSFFNLAV